ncbi:MAG TPA: UvrB/UvrC motif-containing protein [Verrucomicrobiae bacterium]|nr:UvrB/UvrC motif-containing protein [Verrucomicrobiae bacterium]
MNCNICGNNEATLHLTEIVNDHMVEVHLCENCAQEKGSDFKTHFNVGELLTGLSHMDAMSLLGVEKPALKCEQCGLTYDDFGRTGRLGCPGCYGAFTKMLLPLIKRVQRSTQHTGKQPKNMPKSETAAYDLRVLQDRLRKSVENEHFEDAARLRDEIKTIEQRLKKGKKKE